MRFIVLFVVAFLLGIVLAIFDIRGPVSVVISIFVIFSLSLYLFVYPIYLEKNVKKIESYLEKKRKNPLFRLYYGMGNRIDQDVKEATEILLRKYKQPARQAMFITLYALYEDDILRAKSDIEQIQPPRYKYYYQAIVAIEEGKIELAAELREQVKKEWMKHSLAAGIAKKAGYQEEYNVEIQKAYEKTRGLQRYMIFKQFEQDLK